jgi:hypothetical protein
VTNNYVLAADWQAWAASHNIDAAALTSGAVAGTWTAVDFVFGLMLAFTYAAMRPRFGAGIGTAILASLIIYLAPTIVMFGFTMMGMLSMAMFVKGSLGAIVSTFGAGIVAAAIYKEAGAAPSSRPAAARV